MNKTTFEIWYSRNYNNKKEWFLYVTRDSREEAEKLIAEQHAFSDGEEVAIVRVDRTALKMVTAKITFTTQEL